MEATENIHTQNEAVVDTQNPDVPGGAPAAAAPSAEATPAPPVSLKDADDATKLKAFNEMFGTNHKSLSEVFPAAKPSKEELEAQAEEKKKKALAWAVTEGKITADKIEKAVLAKNKQTRDIAFELFAAELREENPKFTDEEVEAHFSDYYREDEQIDSPVRKAAFKRMEKVANAYRAEATGEYEGITEAYDTHETSTARFNNYSTQVKAIAKDIPSEISMTMSHTSGDGTVIEIPIVIPVDDKTRDAVRKDFLNEGTFRAIGAHENEVKPEAIASEMTAAVHSRIFETALKSAMEQYGAAVEKDTLAKVKAIPATGSSTFAKRPEPAQSKDPIKHTRFSEIAAKNGY